MKYQISFANHAFLIFYEVGLSSASSIITACTSTSFINIANMSTAHTSSVPKDNLLVSVTFKKTMGKLILKLLTFVTFVFKSSTKKINLAFKYSNFHEFLFYFPKFHLNYNRSIKTSITLDMIEVRSLIGI